MSDCPSHFCELCKKKFSHSLGECFKPEVKTQVCYTCQILSIPTHTLLNESISKTQRTNDAHEEYAREIGDVSTEAHRAHDLEQIVAGQHILSGKELAEIELEHESFLISQLNGKSSQEIEDFLEKHIIDLKAKIEKFQKQIQSTHKVRADKRQEITAKMSPEEREAYLRKNSARKLIKAAQERSEVKEAKKAMSKKERAVEGFVALGIPYATAYKQVFGVSPEEK